MMMDVQLREATWQDLPEMLAIFRETIWHVNRAHYSEAQLGVWASAAEHGERWLQKLNQQFVLLAVKDGRVLGFGSLRQDYIDLLYVHKDHQGQGIAGMIYDVLEARARDAGMQALATDASISAKPFFEKKGFIFVAIRYYLLDGVEISNNRMVKSLHD
jgi:putative acetyltransferase